MVQAVALPRNEDGIAIVLGVLKQQFGDRFQTSQAIRDQHGHTTTWIKTQAPDAVVFPSSTQEVSDIIKVCATHKVPVIPFGTGTSLEGHVNAPAGGISVDTSQMNQILTVHAGDLDRDLVAHRHMAAIYGAFCHVFHGYLLNGGRF